MLLLAALALQPELFEHEADPRFSFEIPGGFKRMNDPGWIAGFRRGPVVISVRRLGGLLPRTGTRGGIVPPEVPREGRITIDRAAWGEFELQIFHLRLPGELSMSAPVPLRPEAVAVDVTGPASRSGEIRDTLMQVLGTFRGESSWRTADEVRLGRVTGTFRLAGLALLAVYSLFAVAAFRRKPEDFRRRLRVVWLGVVAALLAASAGFGIAFSASRAEPPVADLLVLLASLGALAAAVNRRSGARVIPPEP